MNYIEEMFKQHKWSVYDKNENLTIFKRGDNEFFEIKNSLHNKVKVSFPLYNSEYNYSTEVRGYTNLYNFISDKLEYLDNSSIYI